MNKKYQNIIANLSPYLLFAAIIALWQIVSMTGIVPKFMLPAPSNVINAFVEDFSLLMEHMGMTISEAALGLFISIALAFIMATLMDAFNGLYKAVYPLMVVTQTVPTIAIAPLLVLWLGYGIAPKIVLIVIVCFFPMTIGLLDGFKQADKDTMNLIRAMGATKKQIFTYVKLPWSMSHFFAGLKIAVSYAVVGAVISEWLGGNMGLGVYMTRARKSYAFDKMFAVIFLISAITLILIKLVEILQKRALKWENLKNEQD